MVRPFSLGVEKNYSLHMRQIKCLKNQKMHFYSLNVKHVQEKVNM